MRDSTISVLVWLAVAAHLAVATISWRRLSTLPLVPALNAVVALGVLAYWGQRWIGYLFRGVSWYLTDQLYPGYALLVLVLAVLALAGRPVPALAQWIAFGVNAAALLAAGLFFAFFRMNRLF